MNFVFNAGDEEYNLQKDTLEKLSQIQLRNDSVYGVWYIMKTVTNDGVMRHIKSIGRLYG